MKRFSIVALSLALILSASGALRAEDGAKVAPEQGVAPKVRPTQDGDQKVRPSQDGDQKVRPSQDGDQKVRPSQDGEQDVKLAPDGEQSGKVKTKTFIGTLIKLEMPTQQKQSPVPGSFVVEAHSNTSQQQQQTTQKEKPAAEPMSFVFDSATEIKASTASQDTPALAVGQLVRVTYTKREVERPTKDKGDKGKDGNKEKLDTPNPTLVDPAQEINTKDKGKDKEKVSPSQETAQESPKQKDRPAQESPKQKDRPAQDDNSKLVDGDVPTDGAQNPPKQKDKPQAQEAEAVFYAVSIEILPTQVQKSKN